MGQDELHFAALKKEVQDHAYRLSEPVDYDLKPEKVRTPLLKRIPFLSHFMKDAGEVGNQVLQVSNSITSFRDKVFIDSATNGLQAGAIIFAGIDFLLIPVVYLSAYILNEKVPFTLNNNARWLYASILLGLTFTAIFLPVTAPIIALVTAGLTLGLTTFLLARAVSERLTLGRERKRIAASIAHEENEMSQIQQEAELLAQRLSAPMTSDEFAAISQNILSLQERYEAQKKILTDLKEQQLEIKEKIKKVDFKHILDKGVGVGFAAISVMGLVLSFFFPPIGLGILMGVSTVALAYLVGRITAPLFIAAGKRLMDLAHTKDEKMLVDEQHEKHVEDSLDYHLEKEHSNFDEKKPIDNEPKIDLSRSSMDSEESLPPYTSRRNSTDSFNTILSKLEANPKNISPKSPLFVEKEINDEEDGESESEGVHQREVMENIESDDERDSESVSP